MSVSSHLTPEPERRLWIILENMSRSVELTDMKIGALTAFAAVELLLSRNLSWLSLVTLGAALPLGVFAFSPLTGAPKWFTFLEPHREKPGLGDNMIRTEDIAKYTHNELIARLDKYLGGGITATQYYEDIVGQIVFRARLAARKQRLLRAVCFLVGLGQLGLFGR